MSKKVKVIHTRLDADLVDQAQEVLDKVGLNMADAIRIYLKRIVNTGEVPVKLSTKKSSYYTPAQYALVKDAIDNALNSKNLLTLNPDDDIEDFFDKHFRS